MRRLGLLSLALFCGCQALRSNSHFRTQRSLRPTTDYFDNFETNLTKCGTKCSSHGFCGKSGECTCEIPWKGTTCSNAKFYGRKPLTAQIIELETLGLDWLPDYDVEDAYAALDTISRVHRHVTNSSNKKHSSGTGSHLVPGDHTKRIYEQVLIGNFTASKSGLNTTRRNGGGELLQLGKEAAALATKEARKLVVDDYRLLHPKPDSVVSPGVVSPGPPCEHDCQHQAGAAGGAAAATNLRVVARTRGDNQRYLVPKSQHVPYVSDTKGASPSGMRPAAPRFAEARAGGDEQDEGSELLQL